MKIKKILESFTSGFRSSFNKDTTDTKNIRSTAPLSPVTETTTDSLFTSQISNNEKIQKAEATNIFAINSLDFEAIQKLTKIELKLLTKSHINKDLSVSEKQAIYSYISMQLKDRKEIPFINNTTKSSTPEFPFVRPLTSHKVKKNNTKVVPKPIDGSLDKSDNISLSQPHAYSEPQNTNNYYHKKANSIKPLSAFVSYASSPDSIQVYLNKQKVTIFINGLFHDDEKSPSAILCKQFLDSNLKKQTIYFDKIEDLNENSILANVYFDKNKTINIATVAHKNGFSLSTSKSLTENDLIIPELKTTPKYDNHNDVNISEYSDAKIVSTNPSQKNHFQECFNKYKHLNNKDNLIGLLIEHGEAPFLFDENNSKSYFIKIKQEQKEKIIWGKNLKDSLASQNILPGDFIHLNKYEEINPKTQRKFNIWQTNILEKSFDKKLQENFLNSQLPNTNNQEIPSYFTDEIPIDDNGYKSNEIEKHIEIINGGMDMLFDEENPFLNHNDISKHKNKP